ncbi:MAG: group 1 glycosyl transferase, partial [Acidobacteria bacterium]
AETDPSYRYAIKGYQQIFELRTIVESAIAISPFNEHQLRQRGFGDVAVIPLLKDFTANRHAPHSKLPYFDVSPVLRLLFVGRIVRHKCQDELIEFLGQVPTIGGIPLELVLVGGYEDGEVFKLQLDRLVSLLGVGRKVKFTGRIPDAELFGWFRSASAYVSLSEHEGFGVPLIEAMAFDLPVIAYGSAAVPDTMGAAGITITDKRPASILEPLLRLQEDSAFRRQVIREQRTQVSQFSRKRIELELQRWLTSIGALKDKVQTPCRNAEAHAPQPTRYVVEGPFETSYSLALVNRNLALALDQRNGCEAHIEPGEGTESYSVDTLAANRLPSKIRDLVASAPIEAERIVTIRNTYPPRPNGMLGDVRLLHLAWEESLIPENLTGLINLHLDGVLAPSEYSKRVIRNSGVRLPIAVIGHGIDHSGLPPQVMKGRANRERATPALPFTFLHISSGLPRKGIEELITAYCMAFSRNDPVLLVIKTFDNPNNMIGRWIERISALWEASPAIQVISEELDSQQMAFLYHIADALVLPTRGEGFNLPAAEAMAHGIPVIVTRHSGHLDFCNDENSFLIDCNYEFSTSHLNIPNSYWARASVEQLIDVMKAVYRSGRSLDGLPALRALEAQRAAERLRWRGVAEKAENFVKYLENRPLMTRKLRLGWVSTYNARCGIATYSEHLLECFDTDSFDITIIADDQPAISPDPANVIRLWSKSGIGLARVVDYLISNKFDAALLQYNFGFFDPAEFAELVLALRNANVTVFTVLHRTKDLEDDQSTSHYKIKRALQNCARVFVHNLDDVNRLRESGIVENVVLVPHGVIDREPLDPDAVRALLGLSGFTPVVGTFGFLLPGKGLTELIHSFALLLRAYPTAYLLMVNATYPTPESNKERERCLGLIRQLDMEGQTRLIDQFLKTEEVLFLLNACDTVVFPYQRSEESASGAVRLGLAAGVPILTTALPVFFDLSDVVGQLAGTTAWDIAEGIVSLLRDEGRKSDILQRQRNWLRSNSWAAQAKRLSNMILASVEEAQGIELRAPRAAGLEFTLAADGGGGKQSVVSSPAAGVA